jgi:hypothetical protein
MAEELRQIPELAIGPLVSLAYVDEALAWNKIEELYIRTEKLMKQESTKRLTYEDALLQCPSHTLVSPSIQ